MASIYQSLTLLAALIVTLAVCWAYGAPGERYMYSMGLGKRYSPYSFGLGKRARSYGFGLGKRDRLDDGGFDGIAEPDYAFEEEKRGGRVYSFGLGKRARSSYAFGLGKRDIVLEEARNPVVNVVEPKTSSDDAGQHQ